MITQDTIKTLTIRHQTSELNIIREYFQHLFLSQFYRLEGAENILFKGGTALRVIYGSPRFSEDLDFSIFNVEQYQQKRNYLIYGTRLVISETEAKNAITTAKDFIKEIKEIIQKNNPQKKLV